MSSIVTLTLNPAIDVSTRVDRVVAEHKMRCNAPRYDPGGGGINVSRAIGFLGGDSLALYLSGGPTGTLLQSLLDREGVSHLPIPIAGSIRESFTAFEESTTHQYRFTLPGPTILPDEWRLSLEILAQLSPVPAYIVASGSLPPGVPEDYYAHVAHLCSDKGIRLIVDTSGPALRAALEAGVFLIKPNLRELQLLIGSSIDGQEQQEAVARRLVESGACHCVVVSLGAAGVLFATSEQSERLRAPVVPIRSKVGAGDSMVAGLTLGLARGLPLTEAVRFGIASGAAAVMTPGTELCAREDVERLYGELLH